MAHRLFLASAGAGKSARIAKEALKRAADGGKVLLLTYTINNQLELVRQICQCNTFVPDNVIVKGWFAFLLEDMVRPYQRCVVSDRVTGIFFNSANPHRSMGDDGKMFSIRNRAEVKNGHPNPLHYVTADDCRAYTHYLAKFATTIHKQTGGKPARRLAEIYDSILIDEIQDLVGWDFAVLRAMVKADISELDFVGDFRQTVYRTSATTKKPQTTREKLDKFEDMGFAIENLAISWRCIQSICDFADRLHASDGHYMPTQSQITAVPVEYADHQGIFVVPTSRVEDYIKAYNPVILRWNRLAKNELCKGRATYNFGESKGLSFERVLIIPAERHVKFLHGSTSAFRGVKSDDSRNKLYVGITRARYSVAFLYESESVIDGALVWNSVN